MYECGFNLERKIHILNRSVWKRERDDRVAAALENAVRRHEDATIIFRVRNSLQ